MNAVTAQCFNREYMNVAFCPPSANKCQGKLCMTKTGGQCWTDSSAAARTGIIRGEHPSRSLHTTSAGTPLSSCLLCFVLPSPGTGLNVTNRTVEMRSAPGSRSSPQTAPGWFWLDKQSSPRPQIPPEMRAFLCQNIRTEGTAVLLLERRKIKYLQCVTLGGFVPCGFQSFRSLTQYLLAFIVLLWVKYFKSFSEEMAHSSWQDRHRFVGMPAQAHSVNPQYFPLDWGQDFGRTTPAPRLWCV